MKNYLNNDNVIILSWNSSSNIIYNLNEDVVISPLNINIVNNLDKKYALLVGDQNIPNLNLKVFVHENSIHNIFNYIEDKI